TKETRGAATATPRDKAAVSCARYFVAMIAPRVDVNRVFSKLPGGRGGKIFPFAMSTRLSSISVRWLATTYDRVSVADSTLLEPPEVSPAMMLPWLSPKYSPRSAIAKGSATTNLAARLTPY